MEENTTEIVRRANTTPKTVTIENSLLRASGRLDNVAKRVLLWTISHIDDKRDASIPKFIWSTEEFMQIMAIEGNHRYDRIREAFLELRKTIEIKLGRGKTLITGFISDAVIDAETHEVSISISQAMAPFLLSFSGYFTKYQIVLMAGLRLDYSIPLLELCLERKFASKHSTDGSSWYFNCELRELRERFGHIDPDGNVTKLPLWGNFRARALLPSIDEIAAKTPYIISWEAKKRGPQIFSIDFTILDTSATKKDAKKPASNPKKPLTEEALEKLLEKSSEEIQEEFKAIEGIRLRRALKENAEKPSDLAVAPEFIHRLVRSQLLAEFASKLAP